MKSEFFFTVESHAQPEHVWEDTESQKRRRGAKKGELGLAELHMLG